MRIDQQAIEFLKTYFVPRRGGTHIAGDVLPGGTNTFDLGAPTNRWDTIYARQVIADSLTGGGGATNADTVDGFHASATSGPNQLLALDAAQAYPTTAYPQAILRDGSRSLTGDLDVSSGIKIDGVDISDHVLQDFHHLAGMGADDHVQYVHVSSQRVVTAVHTFNPVAQTPWIVLGANAQDQLITGLYASRAVDLDRSIVAGDGLTGGGLLNTNVTLNAVGGANISVAANSIDLDTPGGLDVNSTNQVATAHTHSITATNNPGASTAILKSGVAGDLYLAGDFGVDTDTLYVDVSEDAVYINAGTLPTRRGALTVHPANVNQRGLVLEQQSGQVANLFTVFDSSGGDLIVLTNAGDLESGDPNFVSGLTGWQITATGEAEFWNATIRGELHASTFVADEMSATGGSLAVMTSGKVVDPGSSGDNVMGAIGADFDLRIQASWNTGLCYFQDDDVVRLKFMGDDGGGLDLWDVYVQLMAAPGSVQGRDLSNGEPGYHILTVRRRQGGSSGLEIPEGTAGVLWGNRTNSGYSGGLWLTSDLTYSPYMDIFTIDNSVTYEPWEPEAITPRVRVGNLGGVLGGSADEWGIAFGSDLSDVAQPYAVFSDLRTSLHGITQDWWDLSGNIRGQLDPTAAGNESLFWLGPSGADPKFEVTGDGLVRMSGAFIGPRGGALINGGVAWMPFDGDPWYGGIETLSNTDWEVPSTETGSVYAGWGKYEKGLVVGDGGTNLIENPSFHNNVSDGWSNNGVGTRVRATAHYNHRSGNGSLRITAGSSTAQVYTTAVDSLPNGWTVWAHVWVKVGSGGGSGDAQLLLYDTSTPATRATKLSTLYANDEWELLACSWTNNTGVAKNIRFYLENRAGDSSTQVWYDACTMTFSANPMPYVDGDKPGCSWAGAAHNSHSYRTQTNLEYAVTLPATWTVSFWWTPTAIAADIPGVSARILEWYGDSNDRLIFYQPAGTSDMRIYHQVSGDLEYDDVNIGAFTRGEHYHVIATYDGSGFQWWVNNVDQGYRSHGQSWGVTPYVLAIGSDVAGNSRSQGVVSDLFILNKTVDADFVDAVYNATVPASINNDLFFKVFSLEAGSTTITPKAVMIRGSGNALGVSTNPDPMVIGGITVDSGDLVLGDNRNESAAIHWDHSEGSFNFYADGASGESMRWDKKGMVFAATAAEDFEAGVKWIRDDYPDDPFGRITVWNSSGDNWMKVKNVAPSGDFAWTQLQSFSNAGAEVDLFAFGKTGAGGISGVDVYDSDATSYVYISPVSASYSGILKVVASNSEVGSVVEVATTKMRFLDTVKSVRVLGGATDYTSHQYIPLQAPVTSPSYWEGQTHSTTGTTSIYLPSRFPAIPTGVKAIYVRLLAKDSFSMNLGSSGGHNNPRTDLYFSIGPTSADPWALACYPWGENIISGIGGICPTNAGDNRYIYYRITASGTNTLSAWIRIWGYFI